MEYKTLCFDDDFLDRNTLVKNLMNVIKKWHEYMHENKSLVISVDAPWGSGKSYLINMWRNWLLSEESSCPNYSVTYYNAWESDDCNNPFIPLVYTLREVEIYGDGQIQQRIKEKAEVFIKSCGIALLKDGISKVIGKETAEMITNGIDEALNQKTEKFFQDYEEYLNQKTLFKEALQDLIPENGKLIVFVDELDRCRPIFAVETLEIIKHFFNIENIVFIFAIDLQQLSHSVSTLYGKDMDAQGYLRRFFDINVNIPKCNIHDYINKKYNDKLSKFNLAGKFFENMDETYKQLNLSLRDIDKITTNFIVFCLYYHDVITLMASLNGQKNLDMRLSIYLYFLTLKYKYPQIYNNIINDGFIAFDNSPKNLFVLDSYYFINGDIKIMLKAIQNRAAQNKSNDFIEKFGLKDINKTGLSYAEHIERTLEMFS